MDVGYAQYAGETRYSNTIQDEKHKKTFLLRKIESFSSRRNRLVQNYKEKGRLHVVGAHEAKNLICWRNVLCSEKTKLNGLAVMVRGILGGKGGSFQVSEHHPNCEVWGFVALCCGDVLVYFTKQIAPCENKIHGGDS